MTKLKTEILDGGDEAFEVPEGWEIFRTAFDRGLWYVVLKKETVTTNTYRADSVLRAEPLHGS